MSQRAEPDRSLNVCLLTRSIDETHPICERCTKRGIQCVYGEGPTKFVDERPKLEAKAAAAQLELLNPSLMDFSLSSSSSSSLVPTIYRSPEPVSISDELPLGGLEEQIYLSFLDYKPMFGHANQRATLMWPWQSSSSPTSNDSIIRLSVQSMAAAYYGRNHRQTSVCFRARQLYGHALESLAAGLNEPEKASHSQLLTSIVALTVYEMLTFQAASGWIQHAGGLGRLFEVRMSSLTQLEVSTC